MHSLLRKLGLTILLAALWGCSPAKSSFEIKVTGDSQFSGAIMVVKDGESEQRTVEGRAPTSYTEEGTLVSVSVQKQSEFGRLGLEILKDGVPVAGQNTTAAYGLVTAATQ